MYLEYIVYIIYYLRCTCNYHSVTVAQNNNEIKKKLVSKKIINYLYFHFAVYKNMQRYTHFISLLHFKESDLKK